MLRKPHNNSPIIGSISIACYKNGETEAHSIKCFVHDHTSSKLPDWYMNLSCTQKMLLTYKKFFSRNSNQEGSHSKNCSPSAWVQYSIQFWLEKRKPKSTLLGVTVFLPEHLENDGYKIFVVSYLWVCLLYIKHL